MASNRLKRKMKPTRNKPRYFVRSWVASVLVVTHLALVVYSLAATPPLTPDFGSDFNRDAHAIPIAGHVVRIPEEGS